MSAFNLKEWFSEKMWEMIFSMRHLSDSFMQNKKSLSGNPKRLFTVRSNLTLLFHENHLSH